jgi:alcohol dehydrogenase (cytochrome c)
VQVIDANLQRRAARALEGVAECDVYLEKSNMRISFGLTLLLCAGAAGAQTPDGRKTFETHCGACHGVDGNGGEFAGSILARIRAMSDAQIESTIRTGVPGRGMPPVPLTNDEIRVVLAHLRTLRAPDSERRDRSRQITTTTGTRLEGVVTDEGIDDLQIRTPDERIHLMRRSGERFREVTSQSDWPAYDGGFTGNRYTTLRQIDKTNVSRLVSRWIFAMDDATGLQTTPVVVNGIMYVTTANQCYALDAGSGRKIWRFQRPRSKALVGNASGGINRGVAVDGDRVFMETDNAHLLALNRFTGALLWDIEMANASQNYSATAAPLAIAGLIVAGTAGGDGGARGFLAAYDPATGQERWRFWTTPAPGEPGSDTWQGRAIEHPGGATWMSGSYDADLGLVYWQTGNPGPDMNGDERLGDNLYTSSVIALDVKTGKLRWYYQFTPHNVWDWDAQQPLTLVDAEWDGHQRKLLLQANRNGFFYVLDRTDGKLLLASPFVEKLTWAKKIGADGRPVLNPNQIPTERGVRVCPSLIGAANWWSNAYDPATGLFYVSALESCAIFSKRDTEWEAGKGFGGGGTREAAEDPPKKYLRALDVHTGRIAWQLPEIGPGTTRGGVLATAGGITFFCADGSEFAAVDSATGKLLWRFPANHFWRASPMTYVFDEKQYVAVASGANILAFGLPD